MLYRTPARLSLHSGLCHSGKNYLSTCKSLNDPTHNDPAPKFFENWKRPVDAAAPSPSRVHRAPPDPSLRHASTQHPQEWFFNGGFITVSGTITSTITFYQTRQHTLLHLFFLVYSQRGSLARHAEPVTLLVAGDWRPMAMRVAMIVTVAAVTCNVACACPQRTLVITTT